MACEPFRSGSTRGPRWGTRRPCPPSRDSRPGGPAAAGPRAGPGRPARHLALVAVEPGQPARLAHAEVGAQGAPGDLADLVQLERRGVVDLVATVPGEHAVPAVAERGHEGERVADPVDGQHVRRRGAQPDVDQHHRLDHGVAGERQPEGLAHGAARAVGADHVGGAVAGGGPVGGPRGDLDTGAVLREAEHLDARQDRHTQLIDAAPQHPLGLVLGRDQQRAVLGRQDAEVQAHRGEQAQLPHGGTGLGELVGETPDLQLLHGPGVHSERPGHVRLTRAPLQHGDPHPGLGQVAGQQQAGRARPDHHYVRVHRGTSLRSTSVGNLARTVVRLRSVCQRMLANVRCRWFGGAVARVTAVPAISLPGNRQKQE